MVHFINTLTEHYISTLVFACNDCAGPLLSIDIRSICLCVGVFVCLGVYLNNHWPDLLGFVHEMSQPTTNTHLVFVLDISNCPY